MTIAPQPARIEVVPLDWDHRENGSYTDGSFDSYQVFAHGNHMPGRWTTGTPIGRDFPSREDAIKAVEESHAARALEAVRLVPSESTTHETQLDITLRDQLAAAALPALIARHRVDVPWSKVAPLAYQIADAMLAVRKGDADG